MNCARVAENLPWYLNRTLATAEQQETRLHLAQCPQCQRQLEETRFTASVHGQHVPEEALVDYAFNRPALSLELELIERHLAACRECVEQLALVEESCGLIDESEQAKGDGGEVVEFRLKPRASAPKPSRSLRLWQYGALAASIAGLAALGGWWWNWQQAVTLRASLTAQQRVTEERLTKLEAENQQLRETAIKPPSPEQTGQEIARLQAQVKELTTPQVNVPVLEVFPQELAERSQRPAVNQLNIPPRAQVITLILNSQSKSEARSYNLEILTAQQQVVANSQGLVRQATGDYTISMPTSLLPPGSYTFNIYGQIDGQRVKVESYRIQIGRTRR